MNVRSQFLFNFAVSYSGGGHKRLYEYAKWFGANGGAWFVVHPNCRNLQEEFPNNRFFIVKQSPIERLSNDCAYLEAIRKEIGRPDLYYSYGIPVYSRFGRINWFHLSNVLPLASAGIPLSRFDRFKLALLGRRIRHELGNADVISAESDYALGLIGPAYLKKSFVSVNGSDDELQYLNQRPVEAREDIATVVGTRSHKALEDSVHVFDMLKRNNANLNLEVIGEEKFIPRPLRARPNIIVRGVLARSDVIECLRRARYYISTTLIENSYNAASEGAFMAEESYISDIGPHRELLMNARFEEVTIPSVNRRLLHVKRKDFTGLGLKTWDAVVVEMIARLQQATNDR